MSFTYRLLRQLPKPYDGGSFTSDTDEGLQEFPQLSTLKRKGADEKINCFVPSQLPDEIILRLNLRLIPMPTRVVMAHLKVNERTWRASNFYELESIHAPNRDIFGCAQWLGVDLIFEGTASFKKENEEHHITPNSFKGFELQCAAGECLFPYRFVMPEQNTYAQEQMMYKRNNWMVNLPPYINEMNAVPFIPYGGFMSDTLDVTRMCQAYALIIDSGAVITQLSLYTQILCNNKGIRFSTPEFETHYKLCADPAHLPTITLSLAGWLTSGHLHVGVKSLATNDTLIYRSKNFKQVDLASGHIDVTFIA